MSKVQDDAEPRMPANEQEAEEYAQAKVFKRNKQLQEPRPPLRHTGVLPEETLQALEDMLSLANAAARDLEPGWSGKEGAMESLSLPNFDTACRMCGILSAQGVVDRMNTIQGVLNRHRHYYEQRKEYTKWTGWIEARAREIEAERVKEELAKKNQMLTPEKRAINQKIDEMLAQPKLP